MDKYLLSTRIFPARRCNSISNRGDPFLLNGALNFMM